MQNFLLCIHGLIESFIKYFNSVYLNFACSLLITSSNKNTC